MKHKKPERGFCFQADLDGEPRVWAIYGHFEEKEALEIATQYDEGDPIENPLITRNFMRVVPSKNCQEPYCDCAGSGHWIQTQQPGHGAFPMTWVEERT